MVSYCQKEIILESADDPSLHGSRPIFSTSACADRKGVGCLSFQEEKAPEIHMPGRPEPDRPLDSVIALAAIREQFPNEGFSRAEPLASGWATDVYVVDDRLVARFPRNAELAEWMDHDEKLVRFVASSLGSDITVPKIWGRGKAGRHFKHGFLMCTFVPGIVADSPDAPFNPAFADDLGAALSLIHSVPAEEARALGVGQPEWDDYQGPLCFLHGDFGPRNLLIDPTSGRLTGIIDWGNAALGHPSSDFGALVLWRGWRFTRAAMAAYRLPMEHDFEDRIRRDAQIQSLQWLTDSIKRRADLELHMTWLKNAFELESASE
jgi:aminoglycoside phosphotransferase (APT) family kinase protein